MSGKCYFSLICLKQGVSKIVFDKWNDICFCEGTPAPEEPMEFLI